MNDANPAAPTDPQLAEYLADRDVLCPSCGTLLRGVSSPVCPSCGATISVPILEASPRQGAQPTILVVRVLAAIAAMVAGYLAFTGLTNSQPAGCSPGQGCGEVLSSKWSSLWGVPVSVPGLFVYLAIFACTFYVNPSRPDARRREAWTALLALAGFAGVGAIWFIYVQAVLIKSFCPYCMIDHTCGLLIAALVFYSAPINSGEWISSKVRSAFTLGTGRAGALIATSAAIVAMFALAQHAFPAKTFQLKRTESVSGSGDTRIIIIDDGQPKKNGKPNPPVAVKDQQPKDKPPVKDGAAPLPAADPYVWLRLPNGPPPDGRVRFQRDSFPVRGDVNAPHMLICLVDYTCPHCRAFHKLLDRTFARYGNQLALMMLPMPLNKDCNRHVQFTDERHIPACDLARLALAVWKTDPTKFAEFDDWLFEPAVAWTASEAKAKAEALVGKDALKATFDTGWAHEQILKTVKVYDLAGQGRIPKVMYNNARIEGTIEEKQFFDLLEGSDGLGIKPVGR